MSFPGIIHTLLGVYVYWKLQIQPDIDSNSNYVEIICLYKAVNKTKVILRYMEALEIQTGAPKLHWEYNTSFIYVVESKIFTTRVKKIDIPV